jgi:hypothetical protein
MIYPVEFDERVLGEEFWKWTKTGVKFNYRNGTKPNTFVYRDSELKVFRFNGENHCGLMAGSEIAECYPTKRFRTSTQSLAEIILTDPRLSTLEGARPGTARLCVDIAFSSPVVASSIVMGYTSNRAIWDLQGSDKSLKELNLTFPVKIA